MFKIAYFSFLAAALLSPLSFAIHHWSTLASALGLILTAVTFAWIGYQRRP